MPIDTTQYANNEWLDMPGTYSGRIISAQEDRNDDNEQLLVITIQTDEGKFRQRYTNNERFGWILNRDLRALGFTNEQQKHFEPEMLIDKYVDFELEMNNKNTYARLKSIKLQSIPF